MMEPNERATRRLKAWLGAALGGGAVGAVLGLIAHSLEAGEHSQISDEPTQNFVVVGIALGAGSGVLYKALGAFRRYGRTGYLLSWTIAGGLTASAVMVPTAISENSWIDILFAAGLGLAGGFSFGLFTEDLFRPGSQ